MHLGHVPSWEKYLVKKYYIPDDIQSNRKGNWKGDFIVAHSLGGIDERRVTPSIETFLLNYENGYKSFEVDFVETSDKELVCRHLWEDPDLQKGIDEKHIPDLKTFKNTLIVDKYTPMSFKDLCILLQEHEDAWIVTDSKDNSTKEVVDHFSEMIQDASELKALSVLDRLVIQVYNPDMFYTLEELYPFKNFIYATYVDWKGDLISFIQTCQFCNKHGINSISMWNYYYCDEIQEIADAYDLDIYIHTENDLSSAKRYLNMGARGIYTDFILPSQLE